MHGLQNRPLNPAQVEHLIDNFTVLRRHLPHDQLCIEMTPEDLEACCEFTVGHMKDHPPNPRHAQWYVNKDTLRQHVTEGRKRVYGRFTDMPVLCWPPGRLPYPQLDGGQTRRAALIKKHRLDIGDKDLAIIDEDNMEVCLFFSAGVWPFSLIDRLINFHLDLRLGHVHRQHGHN